MTLPVLRVGLIGNGTVGSAFASALDANQERLTQRLGARLRLTQVAVQHPDRHRSTLTGVRVHDDAEGLALDQGVDVVVEASGAPNASQWLHRAIARGAAAVSANKQAIAADRTLLALLADRHPLLHCEAAVAAALPIVRALRDSLDGEEIHNIRGVLNGTTTFMLSQIERGARFSDALTLAQELGYAEANAEADLSGRDAAAKLAILATLAWRRPVTVHDVTTKGINENIVDVVRVAREHGSRVRLVAEAWEDAALQLRVEPRILHPRDVLARSEDVVNVVEVQSALAGPLVWYGAGAGGARTASALLGDLLVASRALVGATAGRIAA
ncbi:MAG: homoserine dehydrogenase [Gemmatimonadaceae bacterium]|nr:homoserine dehydrogenase [Gemmatimonadaceae bacterium]